MSSDKNAAIRTVNENMILELTKGKFKPFVDFVREKQKNGIEDNLALCFRGSGGKDVVSIYKYNTKVWDLSFSYNKRRETINKRRVTIELRYARFCDKWLDYVKQLDDLGFTLLDGTKISDKEKELIKPDYSIVKFVYCLDGKNECEIKKIIAVSYKIIREMMENYYTDKKNRRDYFKEYYNRVNNNEIVKTFGKSQVRLEKHTQQEIFMKNHFCVDGLFIYDLEFHQPQKDLVGIDINVFNDFKKNEPDMFGIYFDKSGTPLAICMIEIKSTQSALSQNSGLKKHREGMEKYLECTELMQDRIDEAVGLLSHYAKLGLYGVTEDIVKKLEDNKINLEKKIIFVFTNELKPDTKFRVEGTEYTICDAMKGYGGCSDVKYDKWCCENGAEPFAYIK